MCKNIFSDILFSLQQKYPFKLTVKINFLQIVINLIITSLSLIKTMYMYYFLLKFIEQKLHCKSISQ